MVRPRVYENNAARQAEYRARRAAAQNELLAKLRRLHISVHQDAELAAAHAQAFPINDANALLDDLITFFERKNMRSESRA